jgi:hypothetical protein
MRGDDAAGNGTGSFKYVIGCHSTQETRFEIALDDVASRYCVPRHSMPFNSRNEV